LGVFYALKIAWQRWGKIEFRGEEPKKQHNTERNYAFL